MSSIKEKKIFKILSIILIFGGFFLIILPILYTNYILPIKENAILSMLNSPVVSSLETNELNIIIEEKKIENIGISEKKELEDKAEVTSNKVIKYTVDEYFPLKIIIPKIDIEYEVFEGTDIETLKKGPGHIIGTPLPGQEGRVAISGHRTTYGAPFDRIDELEDDDLIYLESEKAGIFTYQVINIEIVNPDDLYILVGSEKKELLLTTCTPKFTATKRLIVIALLMN